MTGEEIDEAFLAHRARVDEIFASGDWTAYGEEFTEDATYRRNGHADLAGREAIRSWVVQQMGRYPADHIVALDVMWHIVDTEHRAVVYEVRSTMSDPGDGSVHAASTTTSLGYAGGGLWSWGVDVHSPAAYQQMWRSWTEAGYRCGTLSVPDDLSGLDARYPLPRD